MSIEQISIETLWCLPTMIAVALASLFIAQSPPIQRLRIIKWRRISRIRRSEYQQALNAEYENEREKKVILDRLKDAMDIPMESIRIKPLDCESCLTFWIMLLILFLTHSALYNQLVLPFAVAYMTKFLRR